MEKELTLRRRMQYTLGRDRGEKEPLAQKTALSKRGDEAIFEEGSRRAKWKRSLRAGRDSFAEGNSGFKIEDIVKGGLFSRGERLKNSCPQISSQGLEGKEFRGGEEIHKV